MSTRQFILPVSKGLSMHYLLHISIALIHVIIAFCLGLPIYHLICEIIMLKEETTLIDLFNLHLYLKNAQKQKSYTFELKDKGII